MSRHLVCWRLGAWDTWVWILIAPEEDEFISLRFGCTVPDQNRKATHIYEYIFVIVSLNHTYLTTKMNKAVRCYLWWVTFATLNFSSVSWVADLPAGIDLCKPNEDMSKYVLVQWHWKIHRLYLHFLFSHCHWYKAIRWKSDPKKPVTCYITLPKARSVGHGATWEAEKMLSKLRLSYLKPRGSLNFVWWWHIADVMNRTWPPLTTALLKWRVYNIPWIYPNEACMRPFYIMYYHFALCMHMHVARYRSFPMRQTVHWEACDQMFNH